MKKILVDASYTRNIQAAVVKNGKLEGLEYSPSCKKMIKGNIYLAKVTRVEPSLQAAFIDYGEEKQGFISFAEIHSSYYDVPMKYREELEQSDVPIDQSVASINEIKNLNIKGGKNQDLDNLDEAEQADSEMENAIEEIIEEEVENDLATPSEIDLSKLKQKNVEKYKIQEVIKRNQVLLVQAVKEERGNKGASFTTYISLAGRYCVIMPNTGSKGGISRKITDLKERKRLKLIIDAINTSSSNGVIIRTIGHNVGESEIQQDYNYLVRLWNDIRGKTLSSTAPSFIHSEDDILQKIVRDLYDSDTKEIIVEGGESYNKLKDIAKRMSYNEEIVVSLYQDKQPIFSKFKADEQIAELYNPVAYTDSGAYIVINYTEALIAIDVNSGKSTSEKNIEEMAVKTNIEAAKEIARQIRLRDLSGIIVIDFIDMIENRNKRLVERTLRENLMYDKARLQMGYISSLGLVEISRQRLKPSFLESNTIVCKNCCGKGVIRSNDVNSSMIFRTIEGELSKGNFGELRVFISSDNCSYILNQKRKDIEAIERKYKINLYFYQDSQMSADGFAIETVEKSNSFMKNIGEYDEVTTKDRVYSHKPNNKAGDTTKNKRKSSSEKKSYPDKNKTQKANDRSARRKKSTEKIPKVE